MAPISQSLEQPDQLAFGGEPEVALQLAM